MHVGMWGIAAIMGVIASWLFYRYFAPTRWRDWTRTGVVQAFIIAFYAEMYGFPLTIYFLARYFGLDLQWTKGGNLWAQLFGTETAHLVAMGLGYAIVFAGASMIVEGWRAIHRARAEGRLVTDGIYARVRHPQYAGLFLVTFGEGIVHWPTITSVLAFPVIVLAYVRLAHKEERMMLAEFGDAYRDYQRRVPTFVPHRRSQGHLQGAMR